MIHFVRQLFHSSGITSDDLHSLLLSEELSIQTRTYILNESSAQTFTATRMHTYMQGNSNRGSFNRGRGRGQSNFRGNPTLSHINNNFSNFRGTNDRS